MVSSVRSICISFFMQFGVYVCICLVRPLRISLVIALVRYVCVFDYVVIALFMFAFVGYFFSYVFSSFGLFVLSFGISLRR